MISDVLMEKVDQKQSPVVVGLDPDIKRIPMFLKDCSPKTISEEIFNFNKEIIDAVHDLIPAVKPQAAYYEMFGHTGWLALERTILYAQSRDLVVILDGKRNDIGKTSEAYANGLLGKIGLEKKTKTNYPDMLTINAYLGSDGIKPFVEVCKEHQKGLFILAKTSNESSNEFQNKSVILDNEEDQIWFSELTGKQQISAPLYALVGKLINNYAQQLIGKTGYSSIGAVVGAKYKEEAELLRRAMPNSIFLVPGYGAQGGTAKELTNCFNEDGYGAIVNSSRGILYAFEKKEFDDDIQKAAYQATKLMIEDIKNALKNENKYPIHWD